MKDTAGAAHMQGSVGGVGRSAADKERTKLRERQRRSITTKIFHGLRKHGGYRLSPRADINEVLRELAKEAGWVVEPDGTTYRSTHNACSDLCRACGAGLKSGTPTPTSSIIGGGECSTTASPHCISVADSMLGYVGSTSLCYSRNGNPIGDNAFAIYMSGTVSSGIHNPVTLAAYQQQMYLDEARASNQNTPLASPCRRV